MADAAEINLGEIQTIYYYDSVPYIAEAAYMDYGKGGGGGFSAERMDVPINPWSGYHHSIRFHRIRHSITESFYIHKLSWQISLPGQFELMDLNPSLSPCNSRKNN